MLLQTVCPECQSELQPQIGYVNWCQACEWNLEPEKEPLASNVFEGYYQLLSERLGRRLYESLKAQNLLKVPVRSSNGYLAMGFSLLVILFYLPIWPFGLWVLWTSGGQLLNLVLGLAICGFGFMLWPLRGGKHPWLEQVVPREQIPELYGLLDALCERLNTPQLDGIILNERYNAGVSQFGLRRKRILVLGLPYWAMLSPQERYGLLGHELGHLINNDPLHQVIPRMALKILFETGHVICPDGLFPKELEGRVLIGDMRAALMGSKLLMIPVNFLLGLLAQGFWALGHGLLALFWADSQRAEYRADLIGLQLAGLQASLSEMEKMAAADLLLAEMRQRLARRQASAGLFAAVRTRFEQLPDLERERRIRLLGREEHRLDATHPATVYRMQMLRLKALHTPAIEPPDCDWDALEQQLEPFKRQLEQGLLEKLRDSMYYR